MTFLIQDGTRRYHQKKREAQDLQVGFEFEFISKLSSEMKHLRSNNPRTKTSALAQEKKV